MRRKVPFRALLRSEWSKLRSVRATWWCTGLYLLVVGGTGWLAAAGAGTAPRADAAVARRSPASVSASWCSSCSVSWP